MDPSVLGAAAGVEGVEAAEDPLAAGLFVDCCGRGGVGGDAGGELAEADGEEEGGGTERRPLLSWENTRGIAGKKQVTNRIDKIRCGCTGVN